MGVYHTSWGAWMLIESLKFWFYSLSFSLLLSFVQLVQFLTETPAVVLEQQSDKPVLMNGQAVKSVKLGEKEKAKAEKRVVRRQVLMRKIVTDGCDLLIPGTAAGWMDFSSGTVGLASVVSTVLPSGDIWERIKGNS
jgi:hypothetical protein